MFISKDVSVLIPAYNAQDTIERAVSSVCEGTQLPKEIIIFDDASSDSTLDIVRQIEKENEVVKVLSTSQNSGAGSARTKLLENASGQLIAFLDSDDIWFPQKLQNQILLLNSSNADLCICNYEIFGEDERRIGFRYHPKKITYFNMLITNWVPTSMALFKADLLGATEMPKIRRRQDYAFWLQLFQKNKNLKVVTHPEILGRYYRRKSGLSSSARLNVYYNFLMFRREMRFSIVVTIFILLANILIRLFRK